MLLLSHTDTVQNSEDKTIFLYNHKNSVLQRGELEHKSFF